MKNITFILLFSAFSVKSQTDIIKVVLLKGKAHFDNKGLIIELKKSHSSELDKNSILTLMSNATVLVYNKNANIEVGYKKEQKITYNQLINSLNKINRGSLSKKFIVYLDKLYNDIEEKNNSLGVSVGAASRGVQDEVPTYAPKDETIILSDSLLLMFGSETTELTSNLIISNQTTKEQVYNGRPVGNSLLVLGLKPGSYNWEYTIETKNKKAYEFKNSFLVPNLDEKKHILKEISEFQYFLNLCKACLSEEGRKILLSDFMRNNNLYLINN